MHALGPAIAELLCNTAPVMIWTSGPDKLCNFLNLAWLNFTGRDMADDGVARLGRAGRSRRARVGRDRESALRLDGNVSRVEARSTGRARCGARRPAPLGVDCRAAQRSARVSAPPAAMARRIATPARVSAVLAPIRTHSTSDHLEQVEEQDYRERNSEQKETETTHAVHLRLPTPTALHARQGCDPPLTNVSTRGAFPLRVRPRSQLAKRAITRTNKFPRSRAGVCLFWGSRRGQQRRGARGARALAQVKTHQGSVMRGHQSAVRELSHRVSPHPPREPFAAPSKASAAHCETQGASRRERGGAKH